MCSIASHEALDWAEGLSALAWRIWHMLAEQR